MDVVKPKKNVLKGFVTVANVFMENTKRKYFKISTEKCGVSQATLRIKIRKVVDGSAAYVKVFADLCWFGGNKERITRMSEKILYGEVGELTDYIDQLERLLAPSQKSYEGLKEAVQDLLSSADTAVKKCREQEEKENLKKIATRAVGGTLATGAVAAGVAGGVAASIVAGVFTFGVGAIVGLSLTAVAATAAGSGIAAGTGVATHRIASKFAEAEKECMELSQSCSELLSAAESTDEYFSSLGEVLKSISTNLDNVQKTKASYKVPESLTLALECLWKKFEGFDPATIYVIQEDLATKASDFLPNHKR